MDGSIADKETCKVLLVDDQPLTEKLMRRSLGEEPDIILHYCSDPLRAEEMVKRVAPSVILLDLFMPGINGLTLLTRFRSLPGIRDIPILMLSVEESPDIKAEAFSLGANDYLVKLPQKAELLARLRYHSHAYFNTIKIHETENLLRKAKREAEKANQAKSAFLATMSHEIRTPINAILGMSELLKETSLTETQEWFVGTLNRSGETLLTLINDILDLSKIEADQLLLERTVFDLHRLIRETLEFFTFTVLDKNIELKRHLDDDVPQWVRGDPTRLRQVLMNLIGNAVKFTRAGWVGITVCTGKTGYLSFEVHDSGPGIPKEKQREIFQPFSQADTSTTRRHGGTGLGLTISRRLIDLMEGCIDLKSEPGQGSTFTFTVRLPRAGPEEIPQPLDRTDPLTEGKADNALRGLDILLVEDTEENRLVIQGYLFQTRHRLTMAENGAEAVTLFQNGRFDLVLMDIQMPVMDGHEATRRIRAWEKETNAKPTPVAALTAHAMREEVARTKAAGCDLHLTKPIRKARLLEVLNAFQHRAAPLPAPETEPEPTAGETPPVEPGPFQFRKRPGAINRTVFKQLCRDLGAGIKPALQRFLDKLPQRLAAIVDAVEKGNAAESARAAHKLKGAAATLGAERLADLCRELEIITRTERVPTNGRLMTATLEEGGIVQAEIRGLLDDTPVTSEPAGELSDSTVLVCDDDEILLNLVSQILRKKGYTTIETDRGTKALAAFREQGPDLVLMDADMPDMDGFETCRQLREITGGRAVPIIMITALDDERSVRRAFEAGAVEYVTKPIHWPVLLQRIRLQIEAHHAFEKVRQHNDHLEELVTIATNEVKAIVKTAVSGIITVDGNGIITLFNPAAETLFGWSGGEMVGKNITNLMEENIPALYNELQANGFGSGNKKIIGIDRETTAMRKDGSVFPAHLAVGHALLAENKHFFVIFVSDITERKKQEAELRQAMIRAEAGARAKSTFITNMSHEIRTPMNAVIGFAEVVLQDDDLSPRTAEHVKTILDSARALLGLINDVLDASKLESGKFSLETVCFHLPNALTEALRTMAPRAEEKGLTLQVEYDTTLPVHFMGDPTRLRQVLLNMVDNAIKFTTDGHILISVRPTEKREMVHFSVIDSGIGMSGEQMAKVFDAFTQADEATTRQFGGSGLGTTISKQIVELMGGTIWVESEPGEGSTFHFTVRLIEAVDTAGCLFDEVETATAVHASPRQFHVLIAEDIRTNATLVTLRLKQQGHTVHWVDNGRLAVEECQANHYDLLLMDIQMPELDGLEATKKIRQHEQSTGKPRLPVLALTASVLKEDKDKCHAAGMDGVVAKPIDFNHLFTAMEEVVPAGAGKTNTNRNIIVEARDGFDFSALSEVADSDKALKTWRSAKAYTKALSAFAGERREDALEMERLLTTHADDVEPARAVAHALKGVAGNLAIERVARLATEIDADLKSGNREAARSKLSKLHQTLTLTATAIDDLIPAEQASTAPRKTFDADVVSGLLADLLSALDEFNPYIVEPILTRLSGYLPKEDLAAIQNAVEAFDFTHAKAHTHDLAAKLGSTLD